MEKKQSRNIQRLMHRPLKTAFIAVSLMPIAPKTNAAGKAKRILNYMNGGRA